MQTPLTTPPQPHLARFSFPVGPHAKAADPRPGTPEDTLHVVPRGDGWAVKVEGSGAIVAITPTKARAVSQGRDLARSRSTSLVIHRRNGTLQARHDYP